MDYGVLKVFKMKLTSFFEDFLSNGTLNINFKIIQ